MIVEYNWVITIHNTIGTAAKSATNDPDLATTKISQYLDRVDIIMFAKLRGSFFLILLIIVYKIKMRNFLCEVSEIFIFCHVTNK